MLKITAATDDPIAIALRSQMKGEFLKAFAAQDTSLKGKWPNAKLVIYGSTLMRQLSLRENIQFPLAGLKSSDIDIGVTELNNNTRSDQFSAKMGTFVVPIVKECMVKCGFSYLVDGMDHGVHRVQREENPEAIKNLPPEDFLNDFFATKTFTPAEIDRRLKGHKDYEALKPLIPTKPLEVKLVLSINDSHFPTLLNPVKTFCDNEHDTFNRASTLDMLAGKLVRTMSVKYKPTDIIDIYNIVKGYHRDTGKPLKNLVPGSEDNRLSALRVMILSFMPTSIHVYPEKPGLLSNFANTPENKQKFLDTVREEIDSNKMPLLEKSVDDIFETVNKLLQDIINVNLSAFGYGPLKVTAAEMDFLTSINGRVEQRNVPPVTGIARFLKRGAKKPAEPQFTSIEPCVNIELLKAAHPDAFARYPELERTINRNLTTMVDRNLPGQAMGGDFLW